MNSRITSVLLALFVLLNLIGGMHYYLWARLIRDPGWSPLVHRVGTIAIIALAVAMPLSMALGRMVPRPIVSPVAWVVYIWMGFAYMLFLGLLLGDIGRMAFALVGTVDPARRQFVARTVAGAVGLVTLGAGAFALRGGLRELAVKRVNVSLEKLPPEARGLRVVQVSDIHVGPTIGEDFITDMVSRINALSPDLVAITGDLVDGSVRDLGALVRGLGEIRATHGVFFVTGNHEYYSGVDEWLDHLRGLNVRVLRNERVTITHNGHPIDIAGVDDWSARRFGNGHGADLARALDGRDPARPVILLAHQPKQGLAAIERSVCLMLSGHTHGGQLWPFTLLVGLDQPFVTGLHRRRGTQIYVSEGTGYWGPPMRLGSRAEITELILG